MKRSSSSYWEDTSGLSLHRSDHVSVPPAKIDVLIVGAGFCGSWLAYFLKKENPRLTVAIVERDVLGLGASTRNAGFLSCGNISEWLEDLHALGWDETIRTFAARHQGIEILRSELGVGARVDACGSVDFDEITEEKTELMARFNAWLRGEGHEPFYRFRKVRLGGDERTAIENRFDGAIDPVAILRSLHAKLKDLGVPIHGEIEVQSIGNGEAVTRASDGRVKEIRYGRAFLCTNAFAGNLHPGTSIVPARGQIIVTSECDTETHRCLGFLRAGYDYFRFIGNRVLVGGGRLNFREKENTADFEPSGELRDYLSELAAQVIGHRDFAIDYHWAGIMGLQSGSHASISALLRPTVIDERTEELSSCGGWGVTLSPFVTRARAGTYL